MKPLIFTRTDYEGDDALSHLPGFSYWKGTAIRMGSGAFLTVVFYALQTWLAEATNFLGTLFVAAGASTLIIGAYRTAIRLTNKFRHFERAASAGDRVTIFKDGITVDYAHGSLHLSWDAVTSVDHAPSAILLHNDHGTFPLPVADIPKDWSVDDVTQSIAAWRKPTAPEADIPLSSGQINSNSKVTL